MYQSYFKQVTFFSLCACLPSCAAWTGPLLTCPASIEVGEEVQLSASQVDSAILWTIDDSDETGATFTLPDGTESLRATTSNIGDSGFATGTTVITVRANAVGALIVHAKETMIGPPLAFPRPAGSRSCTIEVRASAE